MAEYRFPPEQTVVIVPRGSLAIVFPRRLAYLFVGVELFTAAVWILTHYFPAP